MGDVVSPQKRSQMMAGIQGRNTKPELLVRKGLHTRGFRFRIHRRDLPGNPDIVLPKYQTVIFVHGCFWHAHECRLFKWPKTRSDFWKTKITGNRVRDQRNRDALEKADWKVLYVWECTIRGKNKMELCEVLDELAEKIISK